MSQTIEVLDPVAPARADTAPTARAAARSLRGATVGIIDNSKPNFSLLADDLERLLIEQQGVARVLRHRKSSASIGADAQVLAAIASESALVISGSGD